MAKPRVNINPVRFVEGSMSEEQVQEIAVSAPSAEAAR